MTSDIMQKAKYMARRLLNDISQAVILLAIGYALCSI
jgi:hypothetical protein